MTIKIYEYAGCNPVPPEMYLIPSPLNPRHFYCHTRNIYMGRFRVPAPRVGPGDKF